MRTRNLAISALGLLLTLVGISSMAVAQEVLDQSQESGGIFNAFYQPRGCPSAGVKGAAQTFTAGLSGLLTRVDLDLSKESWTTDAKSIFIEIHAGGPTGELLATSNGVAAAAIPLDPAFSWASFTFSVQPALVDAGQVYAIVLPPDLSTEAEYDPTFLWTGPSSDEYAGGVTWDYYCSLGLPNRWEAYTDGTDRTFRTYVTTFTPAVRQSWGGLKGHYR